MAKSMTLEQVKEKKKNLELSLVDLFKSFEDETELRLNYVRIKRKKIKRPKTKDGFEMDYDEFYEKEKSQPIVDVQTEVDFDLLF